MLEKELATVEKLSTTVMEFFVKYSFELVGAVLVLIAGTIVASWASKISLNLFEKKKMDLALARFVAMIIRISVLAFAVIVALGKIGITITPLVAALSAAIFGASFAVQGTLSNYAAGLAIIFARPFAIGDTITVKEVNGVVQDIKLARTILIDADGVQINIPNKHIVGEIIHNSWANKISDSVIGISYESDAEKAIRAVQQVLEKNPEVARSPKFHVGIREFADSSVNIGYRYWVPTVKFYEITADVNLAIYKAFAKEGIKIPFPQRDVHIISQTAVA